MSVAVKRCWRCGQPAQALETFSKRWYVVQCVGTDQAPCGAQSPLFERAVDAAEWWNERAESDARLELMRDDYDALNRRFDTFYNSPELLRARLAALAAPDEPLLPGDLFVLRQGLGVG